MSRTVESPVRVVVLGLGDPQGGDEAVGSRVLQALAEGYAIPGNVTTVTGPAPNLDLLDALEDAALLVAVDGVYADARPTDVWRVPLDEYERPADVPESLHEASLLEALGVLEMLGQRPAGVLLVVPLGEPRRGHELSPAISSALPALAGALVEELKRAGVDVEPRRKR